MSAAIRWFPVHTDHDGLRVAVGGTRVADGAPITLRISDGVLQGLVGDSASERERRERGLSWRTRESALGRLDLAPLQALVEAWLATPRGGMSGDLSMIGTVLRAEGPTEYWVESLPVGSRRRRRYEAAVVGNAIVVVVGDAGGLHSTIRLTRDHFELTDSVAAGQPRAVPMAIMVSAVRFALAVQALALAVPTETAEVASGEGYRFPRRN